MFVFDPTSAGYAPARSGRISLLPSAAGASPPTPGCRTITCDVGGKLKALVVAVIISLCGVSAETTILTPKEHFGHEVGADHKLIPYPKVLEYLEMIAASSDRVSIEEAGRSTLDNPIKVVVLTSPANQKNLDRLREIARLLAKQGSLPPEESAALIDEGKVIVLVTCTIHSTEVGSTQMVTEFIHDFAYDMIQFR